MTKIQTGADVKDQFKVLTEADIQTYTDSASYIKGHAYYTNGAILEPTLRESVLKALCWGSSGGPYRVEVTLLPISETSSDRLVSFACSCFRGGFCKHIVALLLTWLHQPELFAERTGLMEHLREKSRDELLALLEQLLQRQPDIEALVELLIELPGASSIPTESKPGQGKERTFNPSSIQRQAAAAFHNAGAGWRAAILVATELETLCEIGDRFAEMGQWANAQLVYATIAEETISHYEEMDDQGEISGILEGCAGGLIECLDAQPALPQDERLDVPEREELLSTLFDLWKFGYEYEGIEIDIVREMARSLTADERKMLEGLLLQYISTHPDSSRHPSVSTFLAALE